MRHHPGGTPSERYQLRRHGRSCSRALRSAGVEIRCTPRPNARVRFWSCRSDAVEAETTVDPPVAARRAGPRDRRDDCRRRRRHRRLRSIASLERDRPSSGRLRGPIGSWRFHTWSQDAWSNAGRPTRFIARGVVQESEGGVSARVLDPLRGMRRLSRMTPRTGFPSHVEHGGGAASRAAPTHPISLAKPGDRPVSISRVISHSDGRREHLVPCSIATQLGGIGESARRGQIT
jgi:hypothetical protein